MFVPMTSVRSHGMAGFGKERVIVPWTGRRPGVSLFKIAADSYTLVSVDR
jgi:hypothetical protein